MGIEAKINMQENLVVISVVRNFTLYEKLVQNNPYYEQTKFVCLDNTKENRNISVCYNEFLNNYANYLNTFAHQDQAWFMFCHEDFELQENISKKLSLLDKKSLYAPIGTKFIPKKNKVFLRAYGGVKNSDKKGENVRFYGRTCKTGFEVETFDCQCFLVHSSLINNYQLYFDEKLTFDLYVEDFCINAKEHYGISSRIINMKCQHYSYGKIEQRFYDSLKYLQKKYQDAKQSYSNGLVLEEIGKKLPFPIKRDVNGLKNSLKRRLYYIQKLWKK